MPGTAPVVVLLGTRPEAIKLAPVVIAMRTAELPHRVVATGQHAELADDALELFGVEPDGRLDIVRSAGSLDELLATAIHRVGTELDRIQPAAVVVQGDTTSTLGSALAAFHRHLPVAHVEAGLRSHDLELPFPEEMNRRAVSIVTRWHFAPTTAAAGNLAAERHGGQVHVVGNTVVDATRIILDRPAAALPAALAEFVGEGPYMLATAHRRESWGAGIAGIGGALHEVLDELPDHRLVFVTHPNPLARGPIDTALGRHPRALIVSAVPYPVFLQLLRGARIAVSDSGGVQEEGPALGVPVLVTRRVTERPEGVAAGALRVVGTDPAAIRDATVALLRDPAARQAMAGAGRGIYGDGHAAERIVEVLRRDLAPIGDAQPGQRP